MCGIAGILSLKAKPIQNAEGRLRRMTAMLEHRGPDSQGIYLSQDGLFALGNTRLAIVDPQCSAKHPMETKEGRFVLSFNGEIYNHRDLRDLLEKKGARFHTKTDTEVLLAGLQMEGVKFLEKLDGMWAFAFYDVQSRKLLLSRDLLGERHLFYRMDEEELVFASEVKPLLVDKNTSFAIDFEAFLTALIHFAPPPGMTMVKGINRMLPGHNVEASAGGGIKQYRSQRLRPEKWFGFFKEEPSLEAVITQFEEIFHGVCKKRLPLEVPYLCTLSGGLDSALICLYSSDFGKTKIQTLYGQSSEKPFQNEGDLLDEFDASRFTSKKLNTDHHHVYLNSDEVIPVLKRLSENAFDGLFDNTAAAFEMLARYVKGQGAKVILVAEGPDEFLGYPKDLQGYLAIPGFPNGSFRFSPIHESWGGGVLENILTKEQILSASCCYGVLESVYEGLVPAMDSPQLRALSYASLSLPDMFNLRTDKAYMNASVEARLPYQAPQMVEFLIALPSKFRFNEGQTTKFLMREIAKRHIGKEISQRSKYGFAAPIVLSPNVYKAMHYEDAVRESPVFDVFGFKKGARDFVLRPDNKDMLWPFFVLAKTHEKLKKNLF